LHNGIAIDTSPAPFEGSGGIYSQVSPRDDPQASILTGILYEIRLKTRLRRRCQIIKDPALKPEVERLQRSVTRLLNEWWNDLGIARFYEMRSSSKVS